MQKSMRNYAQNRCQMPALETSLSQDRGGFCNKSMWRCRLGFPVVIDKTMLKGAMTVQNRAETGKKCRLKGLSGNWPRL